MRNPPFPQAAIKTNKPPIVKSRVQIVRLLSMAATGYFYTFKRLRTATPMSMLKYDPIGTTSLQCFQNFMTQNCPRPHCDAIDIGETGLTSKQCAERCYSWSKRRRANEPSDHNCYESICNNTDIIINGVYGGLQLVIEDIIARSQATGGTQPAYRHEQKPRGILCWGQESLGIGYHILGVYSTKTLQQKESPRNRFSDQAASMKPYAPAPKIRSISHVSMPLKQATSMLTHSSSGAGLLPYVLVMRRLDEDGFCC